MAFIRTVIRECKIYGVIAFVVVTVWVYAQSNALERRVEQMTFGGRWNIPAVVEARGEGVVRLADVNADDGIGE